MAAVDMALDISALGRNRVSIFVIVDAEKV
jgi:hypothetical protein